LRRFGRKKAQKAQKKFWSLGGASRDASAGSFAVLEPKALPWAMGGCPVGEAEAESPNIEHRREEEEFNEDCADFGITRMN
jgi:hypothetical protein